MTTTISMPLSPTDAPHEYTVRHEQGCTFVYGPIPIADFVKLTRSGTAGDIIDVHLGRLARATCVFGQREACRALYARYEAQERARVLAQYPMLDPPAQEWLAVGDQGASSAALFFHWTGVRPYFVQCGPASAQTPSAAPRDSEDFARCQRLLEQVPAFAARLTEARTLSPIWARLVDAWPALTEMLDGEAPDWRTAEHWWAPKTSERLAALIGGAG